MAVLKCKMCGGELNFELDATVCECEYCGSKQTVPVADNEKKMKLFDRANRLRFNCEFDKASSIYESIIDEFPEEAEGYWGNLLCTYGIEYVDDPATGDKIPTCHRSSFTCFLDEADFEQVMENADAVSRSVYREQAKQIEEIRKGIIEVSGKENPYDIFICYKETDENGERTIDSVLAQDVYDALTNKGYRVFFSRISLEDKLGTEYEPYIFAALNSAKLMLAFGTSYDYYNAVWVKNEWGRFLKLMASDKDKHLIPCYKDIDAYDMPKEFRSLQAQDMGKVGAVQDLIRGIDKLIGKTEKSSDAESKTVVQQVVSSGPNVDALLNRGYDSLEDKAFEEAKKLFSDVLNINAQSAEAYLGLFMAEVRTENQSAAQSKYVAGNYTENRYWKRAKQYAAGALADTLKQWDSERNDRLKKESEAVRKAREEADRKVKEAREEADRKVKEAREEADRKAKEIEKQINQKQNEAEEKAKELYLLRKKLKNGVLELTAEEKSETERLKNLAKNLEQDVKNAETALENCPEKQEILRLEADVKAKQTKIANLGIFKGKEKKELQAQINSLEMNLSELRKAVEIKKQKAEFLRNRLFYAKNQANEYTAGLFNQKKEKLKSQIRKLESQINELESQINELESQINELESQINELESQMESQINELESQMESQISELVYQINDPDLIKQFLPYKFEIVKDKCFGCGLCARPCPVSAITRTDYTAPGKKLKAMEIDQNKCIKCGKCMASCKFKAIVKAPE